MKASRAQIAQNIQDKIFEKMTVEKKLRLASDFFSFARKLNPRHLLDYGAARFDKKNRGNSKSP